MTDTPPIDSMAGRFRQIPSATVFDTMDKLGFPNTVLSLGIKPLRHDMRIAGPAFTVKGTRDPRHHDEEENVRPPKFDNWGMYRAMYPGCVVVIDGGPDRHCGLTGEMMSYQSKQYGARGVVVDGGIRDGPGLLLIPEWPVFVRYTSPIESARRYCYVDFEVALYLSGTLSEYVRVNPGDWIIGDMDGVIAVPKEIAGDVLAKAEEVNRREFESRQALRNGVPFDEVFPAFSQGLAPGLTMAASSQFGNSLLTSPSYKWIVVGVLSIVAFLNEIDRHAIYALFPLLEKDLGMSKMALGMLGSAFLWAYAVLGPQAGWVGDRFPRRYVITLSLVFWSLMTGLNGLATTGNQLIYLRVLLAVSEAFYMPCALALIAEHHGEDTRSKAIALHLSALAIGQVSGGFLGGFMAEHFSWRTLFVMLGGAGIVYAPFMLMLLRSPAEPAAGGAKPERLSFVKAGSIVTRVATLRFFAVAFICYSIVGSVMQTWLPYFLFHTFHTSLAAAGFSAAFYLQLPTAVGNLAGGALGDYFATRDYRGRMLVQAGSLIVSAPFLLSMGMAGSITMVALSLVALGFLRAGWPPNVMAVIFQVLPANLSSTTYGFLNFLGNVSAGIAVTLASDLGGRFGFGAAFASLTLIHWLAGAMLLVAAFSHLKKDFISRPMEAGAEPLTAEA